LPLQKAGLTVSIPSGHPTGQVFNPTTEFVVSDGIVSRPAVFIFASTTGVVTGWNPQVSMTSAQRSAFTNPDAIYTGITLANNGSANYLYLADFRNRKVQVVDANFNSVTLAGTFTDPELPADYTPFNVAAINGKLYVAYAKQAANGEDEVTGPHLGFINVFDLNGTFLQRLVSQGKLNAPWAMVVAPADFGDFSGEGGVGSGQFGGPLLNSALQRMVSLVSLQSDQVEKMNGDPDGYGQENKIRNAKSPNAEGGLAACSAFQHHVDRAAEQQQARAGDSGSARA
jgi:uncharacterized protein (TIGR03118 family)